MSVVRPWLSVLLMVIVSSRWRVGRLTLTGRQRHLHWPPGVMQLRLGPRFAEMVRASPALVASERSLRNAQEQALAAEHRRSCPDLPRSDTADRVTPVARLTRRSLNPRPLYSANPDEEPICAGDGHLRRQLRHGRQAADRAAEGRREQQVPPDLDRPS